MSGWLRVLGIVEMFQQAPVFIVTTKADVPGRCYVSLILFNTEEVS